MREGRFHCAIGPVMNEVQAQALRREFAARRRWIPHGTLLAPILELARRYDCPHRFSIGKGRHYCTSNCYLRHFASNPVSLSAPTLKGG